MNQKFDNVELRKLPVGALNEIVDILETNCDWKKLMSVIPKNPEDLCEMKSPEDLKYNGEHIRIIEEHCKSTESKCAEILFEEWGSSGRKRPTLRNLMNIACKANLYRAADSIANMIGVSLPPRPCDGPAAFINTDVSSILRNESMEQRLNAMGSVGNDYFDPSDKMKGQSDPTHAIGNQTTAQMKSTSDLIKFSDNNIKPESIYENSISNKTTAQMKSENDPKIAPQIQTEAVSSLNSMEIPNFDDIMKSRAQLPSLNENSNSNISDSTILSTTSESDDNTTHRTENSVSLLKNNTQKSSANNVGPQAYQMSFPNIDFEIESSRSGIEQSILEDTNLVHFKYKSLAEISNDFAEELSHGTNGLTGLIGSGGFGKVFVGQHHSYGAIAIKKFHGSLPSVGKRDTTIILKTVFNSEVKSLTQFKHENIVPIIGISIDGPALCLICEYIDGGSLQQKLAANILNAKQRMSIMIGTAEGLKYIHKNDFYRTSNSDSQNSKKNIHGDVKSANILLTRECIPKLCDFGLSKEYDSTFITINPAGTSAYMAPEGFHGTITQKLDIYSFGIVLLELLTGFKPIVKDMEKGESIHIKLYIEETCGSDVSKLVDPVVGNWEKANDIYDLARHCCEKDRQNRPSIDQVCDILLRIHCA